jgi:hypothetical protein
MVPVTKKRTRVHYETVMKTVKQTEYQRRTVTSMVPRTVTSYTTETYTESVPVTTTRQVVEECGSYEAHGAQDQRRAWLYPCLRSRVWRRLRVLPRWRSGRLLHHDRHGARAGFRFPARRPLGL